MGDPHDFDAWHTEEGNVDPRDHHGDDVEEVDARDHDLWGFTDRSHPRGRGPRDEGVDGHGSWDDGPALAPARSRSGRPEWFAPVLVMVLAIFAFAGAWLLTRGGSSKTPTVTAPVTVTASPSTPTDAQTPQSTAAAPTSPTSASSESSSASSSSGSSSSSSSSSSSDSATASPPADASATCGDGEPLDDDGVKLGAGTHTSCPYIADAVSQVRAHVAQDANATSFSISPYSTVLKRTIPLTCSRAQHLTRCSGGNEVNFWVTG